MSFETYKRGAGGCANGKCSHHAADHWAVWAVIRAYTGRHATGVRVNTKAGRTAIVASIGEFGRSGHSSARYIHRVRQAATVWRGGKLVMVASSWLCGSASCGARGVPGGIEDGYVRCRRCEFVFESRKVAA